MGEGVLPLTSLCELGLPPLLQGFVLSIEKDAMPSVVHREPCIFGPICRGTCLVVTTQTQRDLVDQLFSSA
jgi:hypothetical protein